MKLIALLVLVGPISCALAGVAQERWVPWTNQAAEVHENEGRNIFTDLMSIALKSNKDKRNIIDLLSSLLEPANGERDAQLQEKRDFISMVLGGLFGANEQIERDESGVKQQESRGALGDILGFFLQPTNKARRNFIDGLFSSIFDKKSERGVTGSPRKHGKHRHHKHHGKHCHGKHRHGKHHHKHHGTGHPHKHHGTGRPHIN